LIEEETARWQAQKQQECEQWYADILKQYEHMERNALVYLACREHERALKGR
jgi:hypothetical protein